MEMFARDFLIGPIHDSLHWSLLIVGHSGLEDEQTKRKACMLRLDSLLHCRPIIFNIMMLSICFHVFLHHVWLAWMLWEEHYP